MKIALDTMGGDRAPGEIINGALEAIREGSPHLRMVLVGQRDKIEQCLTGKDFPRERCEIVHASEVVGMSESPAAAIRRKKDSSIAIATQLHKEDKVEAVVSAGNTGAVVASSLFSLGRIAGIDRPAIAIVFPTRNGGTVLLDGGANSDCTPQHLEQFAMMGEVYARLFFERENPRIGLLSIGEEQSKGNELTREAHQLLKSSGMNFVGNVEGRDIIAETVDVVITDGFVGNVILKFTESIIYYINSLIKEGIKDSVLAKAGAVLMKPVFERMKKTLDYEEYGGMPLLGVDGVTIIGHGGSSAKAIKNAIFAAERFIESGINQKIKLKMEAIHS
ncbi:MAG: phosphate acyltransferase PlsX [Candidatus Krumholzibacteriota bacterium]|nr:phosphate acyltransferase PlsX [Candidatus Krumholzibacteriota bacterium]